MMKKATLLASVLTFVATAQAQESDITYETSETTEVSNGANLLSELWLVEDATPLDTGQVDLRLTLGWVTASAPANRGESDDDFVVVPSLVWGLCNNVEVFASVPVWVGDGGDVGPLDVGNADTMLGFTWRIHEPVDSWPALALGGSMRVPTGDDSSGVDGELRLILTNEYDSGVRSHFNAFAQTVNGDNDPNLRHFQWGAVLGLDGPLCGDGAVRWVADYLHRSSYHFGSRNINMLEFGWEWAMTAAQKLGMSMQVGLDDNDDTPNFGAAISYAYALTY